MLRGGEMQGAPCTHRPQSKTLSAMRPSVTVPPMFTRRTKSVVMSLQTLKEGNLYKRGKINTEWRQRLFVLNGKQLAYFKGGVSSLSHTCIHLINLPSPYAVHASTSYIAQ